MTCSKKETGKEKIDPLQRRGKKREPNGYKLEHKEKSFSSQRGLRDTNLEPLPLHQPLEALYGSAGRVQDDLGQGGDLQGGVCPLRPVDQHRRALPETRRRTNTNIRPPSPLHGPLISVFVTRYWLTARASLAPRLFMKWASVVILKIAFKRITSI